MTFLVEGLRASRSILESPLVIEAVIAIRRDSQPNDLAGIIDRAMARGIEVRWVDEKHARRYFETKNPQGIGLIVKRPESEPIENLLEKARRVLILDGLSDPGNAGALMRTAHLLGWDAVLFTEGSVSPWSEKTVRASAGVIGFIPVERLSSARIAEALSNQGFRLLIADPKGEEAGVAEKSERMALVLGGEARGSASPWPGARRIAIKIQSGAVDSLGVAASGAILLERYRA
jgi:TrmH family RNA methyltransferase